MVYIIPERGNRPLSVCRSIRVTASTAMDGDQIQMASLSCGAKIGLDGTNSIEKTTFMQTN